MKGLRMVSRKNQSTLAILLIFVLFVNLFNVQVAFAEGETPTEPPVATEAGTEPTVESTPEPEATPLPAEETPVAPASESTEPAPTQAPAEAESTVVAGILSDVPEDTDLVVLDESGQPVALGTQATADAVVKSDPVWCPAGQFPGGVGCSTNYASIPDLLEAMRSNPSAFAANGTIFLEHSGTTTFNTPLVLDDSAGSLSGSFSTLSSFNLTVRGGWNGGTGSGSVGGTQALFDASGSNQGYILIGSLANPWIGNITLQDIEIRNASLASSVAVYTSSGNINFDDVDVAQQTGDKYLAYLHSQTGNITVANGSNFDGNDAGTGINESKGFYAQAGTGSITITGTGSSYTFKDNEGTDPDSHNGATLLAPTVTLNNVRSQANDGNGIEILGATLVTLNNVTSSLNQTGGAGNGLSGVLINGSASTVVNVYGGTFAKNGRFGIELFNGTGTLVVHTAPTCPTAGATANGLGCYNVTPVAPNVTPTQPTPTQPTPTQPTPTQPTPTQPTPTQPTPTEPAPTQPTPTEATPTPPTAAPTQATATPPAPGTSAGGSSAPGTASSSNNVIPVTGGQRMDLDCDSVFLVFGVRVSFMNLCDQQTVINAVEGSTLPGDLPAGYSFVMGLDLDILSDGQSLETLPAGTGVELDFPVGATGEYAVLFWDEDQGKWVEVSSALDAAQLTGALNSEDGDGLYQLSEDVPDLFLEVLTTNKTGIFVLVQK